MAAKLAGAAQIVAIDRHESRLELASKYGASQTLRVEPSALAAAILDVVKGGADYALVVGAKVYTLKGNKADFDKFAGEKATVKGTVSGNVIQATSIAKPKK